MSLKTNNFKLFKYEDSDAADLRFLHDSMDIIDKGINPFYVTTLDSANTYKVTTGLNKTALNDGYSIKVAIPSDSTGAVSIKVDSVTIAVKKPNGSAVTNFKQNAVYSLTYFNGNFILASGGGTDTVNFTSDKLLTGYSANDSNGEKINGTMPNRGEYQMAGGVGSGNDYIALNKIPYGYYPQSSNGWAPEIRAKKTDVANHIGLTANKIVAGNTICGVTGNVTIQSLGGYSKNDIKNKGIITRYKVVKLSEKALNLNGKSNSMLEVLQKKIYYVRSSGDKYCEVFCIDNNLNNLIFVKSNGTASTKYNKDYYDYLQYVNFNSFTTTSYESDTYLPLDEVGQGKRYHLIPLEGNTKYGKLVVNQSRTNDSSGNSWCSTSTIRLQTNALTYDLLDLNHYGWLFNYSSSSDRFTTIVNKKEGSSNHQYKTEYQIVPEIVDKNGNVIA